MRTTDIFARVDGKLARWTLGEPTPVQEAIEFVIEAANPPKPVLALIVGGKPEEKNRE